MRKLLLILVLASVSLAQLSFAGNASELDLRIGVRTDAKPFSYRPENKAMLSTQETRGPLLASGYSGYMVYLCDQVLTEMIISGVSNFKINIVPVDAQERFQKLRDGNIDILCDPATITEDRLDGLRVSLPLFLSGIGFASQPTRIVNNCKTIIGFVGNTTTAFTGIDQIFALGEWPSFQDKILKYRGDDEGWKQANPICDAPQSQKPPIVAFRTHREVAEAFCNNELQYYVGDSEIVFSSIETKSGCKFAASSTTFTDERYAIFGTNNLDDPERYILVSRFFSILTRLVLSDPSVIDRAFKHSFPNASPSKKLQLFFWSLRG